MTELNKDIMLKDIEKILVHLNNINKELQQVYNMLYKVVKEGLND